MNIKPIVISLALLLMSGGTLADDDCNDPLAEWQPRKDLRKQLEAEGWTVFRIKVDDGCYEVKGKDPNGYRVEAEFSPVTFELREIEREDDDQHGKSRSHSESGKAERVPRKNAVKGQPSVIVE
ncbi:MAG: PepSY domain-containing protein [Exilibacterium sp.]